MKHYTIRTYNFQESFKNHDFAIFCCEDLMKCHEEKKAYIPAFCLMPDHLHLCLENEENLAGSFVAEWKSFTTNQSWSFGFQGRLWQRRCFPRTAFSEWSRTNMIDYVLYNPADAGLVRNWRDWPYWAVPPEGRTGWRRGGAAPGPAV